MKVSRSTKEIAAFYKYQRTPRKFHMISIRPIWMAKTKRKDHLPADACHRFTGRITHTLETRHGAAGRTGRAARNGKNEKVSYNSVP